MKKILVTGGTGFIGSHVVVQLLNKNYQVFVLDNLSNSKKIVLEKIRKITGKLPNFIEGDIRNINLINQIFNENIFEGLMHFAALKSLSDSEINAEKYYDNNVVGSNNLLDIAVKKNIKKIIFSSSAAVYGNQKSAKVVETMLLDPITNYGKNKLLIEKKIQKFQTESKNISFVIFRYFNAVGAHPSGIIGEDIRETTSNLMPLVSKTAFGQIKKLTIFGNDYPTKDGTGLRDYIHVEDLATAHIKGLEFFPKNKNISTFNLGVGKAYSVLDVVKTFELVSKRKIPYEFSKKRPGDLAECYADPFLANSDLQWKAKLNLEDICRDVWNFQIKNPMGYE